MIRPIVTDKTALKIRSEECNIEADTDLAGQIQDLIDTAKNAHRCGGLAFNQIGILKRGFVLNAVGGCLPVLNPKVIAKSTVVKAGFESCLSLPDRDPVKVRRSVHIIISYYDPREKCSRTAKFTKLAARVVQHEMDHLNGILI